MFHFSTVCPPFLSSSTWSCLYRPRPPLFSPSFFIIFAYKQIFWNWLRSKVFSDGSFHTYSENQQEVWARCEKYFHNSFLQEMTQKHIDVAHPNVSLFTCVLQWEVVWSQNPVVWRSSERLWWESLYNTVSPLFSGKRKPPWLFLTVHTLITENIQM